MADDSIEAGIGKHRSLNPRLFFAATQNLSAYIPPSLRMRNEQQATIRMRNFKRHASVIAGIFMAAVFVTASSVEGKDLATIKGDVYRKVKVDHLDHKGMVITSDKGTHIIPFAEMAPATRPQFGCFVFGKKAAAGKNSAISVMFVPSDKETIEIVSSTYMKGRSDRGKKDWEWAESRVDQLFKKKGLTLVQDEPDMALVVRYSLRKMNTGRVSRGTRLDEDVAMPSSTDMFFLKLDASLTMGAEVIFAAKAKAASNIVYAWEKQDPPDSKAAKRNAQHDSSYTRFDDEIERFCADLRLPLPKADKNSIPRK